VTETLQFFDESGCGDTVNRILTRRIDVEDQHNVRKVESASEIVEEVQRSCVAMRLKDCKNPSEISAFGCAQRRANLGGMMCVIVDYSYAIARLDLEPAIDAVETFESARNQMASTPMSRAAANAAVAFKTLCIPGTSSRSFCGPPPLKRRVNVDSNPSSAT